MSSWQFHPYAFNFSPWFFHSIYIYAICANVKCTKFFSFFVFLYNFAEVRWDELDKWKRKSLSASRLMAMAEEWKGIKKSLCFAIFFHLISWKLLSMQSSTQSLSKIEENLHFCWLENCVNVPRDQRKPGSFPLEVAACQSG